MVWIILGSTSPLVVSLQRREDRVMSGMGGAFLFPLGVRCHCLRGEEVVKWSLEGAGLGASAGSRGMGKKVFSDDL